MDEKAIGDRLDNFASTHGAVLLGMHKELCSLKESSEFRIAHALSEVRQELAVFSEDKKSLIADVQSTAKGVNQALSSANIRIAHVLSEVRQELAVFSEDKKSLIADVQSTAKGVNQALSSANQKSAEIKIEVDQLYKNFRAIVIHEQKTSKALEQKLSLKEQQIHDLLLKTREEIQQHHLAVIRFKKITQQVLVGLVALLSVVMWYGMSR